MKREEERILTLLNSYELHIPEVFEYENRTIDLNDYVTSNNPSEKIEDDESSKRSLTAVGRHSVSLTLSVCDKYGREYSRELSQEYEIIDTNYPIIDLKSTEITIIESEVLDLNSIINSVYDIVDGELSYSSASMQGYYWFEHIPNNVAGEYVVTIVAEDINGNITTQDINVIIMKKTTDSSSSRKSSTDNINFDAVFTTKYPHGGNAQDLLDEGYIIYYIGDYFHHNNQSFMNLFWKCKAGSKIIVDGNTYTSKGIYHGWCDSGHVFYDDGSPSWYKNDILEMITCDSNGENLRWILVLE